MFRDHALELSESRVYCKDFDPGRLVARGSNLLGALSADRLAMDAGAEFVIMSPEASVQVLKEFSPMLKLDQDAAKGRGIVASSRVSILDDPALDAQSGSVPFDDEGTAAGEKYLINKGVFIRSAADIRTSFERGYLDRQWLPRRARRFSPGPVFQPLFQALGRSACPFAAPGAERPFGVPGQMAGPRPPTRRTCILGLRLFF